MGEIELDADVIGALERNNPCYRKRHVESSRAGELLSADTSKRCTAFLRTAWDRGWCDPDRQRARVLRYNRHLCELFLALNDIEHRRIPIKRPQTNGFVGRFIRTAKQFFTLAFRRKLHTSLETLPAGSDA